MQILSEKRTKCHLKVVHGEHLADTTYNVDNCYLQKCVYIPGVIISPGENVFKD